MCEDKFEQYMKEERRYLYERINLLRLIKPGNNGIRDVFFRYSFTVMGFENMVEHCSYNQTRNFIDSRKFTLSEEEIVSCNQWLNDYCNAPYTLLKESIDEFSWGLEQDDTPTGFEQHITATLKKLRDKSMWLTLPDGSETTVGWLAKATTNKKSGIAHIKLDEDMVPYLFDLKQKFTQYQLYNVLGMKSAFSVRIYELMKSYSFRHTIIFELNELKELLMVEHVKSYVNYKDFRVKVLEKAQTEINELTDINIEFEPIKTGRKVTSIKFIIEEKFKNSRK